MKSLREDLDVVESFLYRVIKGSHRRDENGVTVVYNQGDKIALTPKEVAAFPDKFAPVVEPVAAPAPADTGVSVEDTLAAANAEAAEIVATANAQAEEIITAANVQAKEINDTATARAATAPMKR